MRTASLSLIGLYNWDNTLFDTMSFPEEFGAADKTLFTNNLLMDCAELEVIYSDCAFMKFAIENWSAKELPTWQRIFNAMTAEYDPIENYNRNEDVTETHSGSITHSGKDTVQASGTDSVAASGKDTIQLSGNDTITLSGKDTNQASGTDSDGHTGTQTVSGSGTDTDTLSKTSFENNTYAAVQKNEMQKGSSQTTTFNDTISHTNGRKDELSYGKVDTTAYGKKDETTYGRTDTTTHGRKDETTHGHIITDTTSVTTSGNIHGNIGVTTSQQMLEQELNIAPKLNVMNYMIESFKNRFCLMVY